MCSLTFDHGIKNIVPNGSVVSVEIKDGDISEINFHW